MNTFEEQLKSAIREIKPTDVERERLRNTLKSSMAQTSLPTVSRRMYSGILVRNKLKKTMPIALIIALLMSGSVSYAAEGTAPGDTLYPVKIHVNEGMRSVLAVSDSAKAKLEVDLAERRLFEAEHLKSEDRLDATTTALLREQFSSHRSRADEHLKDLKEKKSNDADIISVDFSQRLRGHHDVLSEFGIQDNDDDDRNGSRIEGEDNHDQERRGRGTDSSSDIQSGTSSSNGSSIESRRGGGDRKDEQEVEVEHSRGDDSSLSGNQSGRGSRSDDGDDEEDNDKSGRGSGGTVLPTPPVTPPVVSSTGTPVTSYTLASIASHSTASSCYSAISGSVYDLTPFISGHPGGSTAILSLCGHDGTAGFLAQHAGKSKPQSMLAGFRLGTLAN